MILHGLGWARFSRKAFDEGTGQGLLLWSPFPDANKALRSTLLRWVGLEQIFKFVDDRQSASDYIRELEQGASLEVDGYRWSASLWRDSFNITLPVALASEEQAAHAYRKARQDRQAHPRRIAPGQRRSGGVTTTSRTLVGFMLRIVTGSPPSPRNLTKELLVLEAIQNRELIFWMAWLSHSGNLSSPSRQL